MSCACNEAACNLALPGVPVARPGLASPQFIAVHETDGHVASHPVHALPSNASNCPAFQPCSIGRRMPVSLCLLCLRPGRMEPTVTPGLTRPLPDVTCPGWGPTWVPSCQWLQRTVQLTSDAFWGRLNRL